MAYFEIIEIRDGITFDFYTGLPHMHVGTGNDYTISHFSGSLTDYTCDSGCEESIISPPTEVEVLEYTVAFSASSACSSVKTTWR